MLLRTRVCIRRSIRQSGQSGQSGHSVRLTVLIGACLASWSLAPPAMAVVAFSLDGASPSVPGTHNSGDILLAAGQTRPTVVAVTAAALGLGTGDEVDAISTGVIGIGFVLYYSVSRGSLSPKC